MEAILENQEVKKEKNTFTKPSYYRNMGIDVISFCQANDIAFAEGNIIKYVCRWKNKNGLEDLYKARDYLNRLIKKVKHEEEKNAER